MLEMPEKPRLRLSLEHFSLIEDERERWRPLPEVPLLVVCGTRQKFNQAAAKTRRRKLPLPRPHPPAIARKPDSGP